ncbi:MAG: CehA/McbA family metallohydrolase [Phycisphaerae bacterium]
MPRTSIVSPYRTAPDSFWMRGNLHTHTKGSDGASHPQEMVRHYASLGHDFLMISDHDVATEVKRLDPCGMVLIRGNEVSGGGPHLLDVGARRLINAHTDVQANIDEINRTSGFAVLCHPNWEEHFNHYPYEVLLALKDYAGIEILNGVVHDMPGNHIATDKWDRLLAAGRMVWGYGNDDAHRIPQAGRGWNVVLVRERTAKAVLAALRTGSFYVSSGVVIDSITTDGPKLTVRAPNADLITVYGHLGSRIFHADGPEMTFDASNYAGRLFRVECSGPRGTMAWTQPFIIRNGRYDELQAKLAKLGSLAKARIRAYRAPRPPNLTGRINDPLWAKAQVFDRFIKIKDGTRPEVRTELRVILAKDTLFFAVKCEEPLLENMKLNIDSDGQGGLWTDDSIEFFLDVDGKGGSYYHLMINANGCTYAVRRGQGLPGEPPRIERPKVKGKAGRWENRDAPCFSRDGGTEQVIARSANVADAGKIGCVPIFRRGWSVEFAIGLEQLDVKPRKGQRMGFHVCRNRNAAPGCFVWSWVAGTNHNVAQYGSLML